MAAKKQNRRRRQFRKRKTTAINWGIALFLEFVAVIAFLNVWAIARDARDPEPESVPQSVPEFVSQSFEDWRDDIEAEYQEIIRPNVSEFHSTFDQYDWR